MKVYYVHIHIVDDIYLLKEYQKVNHNFNYSEIEYANIKAYGYYYNGTEDYKTFSYFLDINHKFKTHTFLSDAQNVIKSYERNRIINELV